MKTILFAALALSLGFSLSPAEDTAGEHPIAQAVAAKLANPKKKFTLIVKAKVKEGEADKFVAAFAAAVESTRKESGCSRYELNRLSDDKNVFVVYERWSGLDKLKAHLAAAHTKTLLETTKPMLDGEPEIFVLTPEADPKKPKTPAEGAGGQKAEIENLKRQFEKERTAVEKAVKEAQDELKKEIEKPREDIRKAIEARK